MHVLIYDLDVSHQVYCSVFVYFIIGNVVVSGKRN